MTMQPLPDEDLLKVADRILLLLVEVEREERVTVKHLRLLQIISELDHRGEICTSAKVVKTTGWPGSTVSRLLKELAALGHDRHSGFISLKEDPANRRSKIIELTPAAEQCKLRVLRGLREAFGDMN